MCPRTVFALTWFLSVLVTFAGAETPVVDRYPRGLGLNAGLVNGVGLSYRFLPATTGYQVTGVLFKGDSVSGPSTINYALAAGLIHPLGAFNLAPGFDAIPYAQVSLGGIGSILLPSSSAVFNEQSGRLDGLFSLGLSYGLEWIVWEHLSLCFELGTALGFEFPANRSAAWGIRPWASVSPQGALYFRF